MSAVTSDASPQAKRRKINNNNNKLKIGDTFNNLARIQETGAYSDVEVLVGPEKQSFKLHKTIICANSEYFCAALESNRFKESQENKIELPEQDPKAFRHIVHWLYHGKLLPLDTGDESEDRWSISVHCGNIEAAKYFIIPSLVTISIEEAVEELTDKYSARWYRTTGQCSDDLTEGLSIIFKNYDKSLEPILRAISENRFLKQVMEDETLKEILMDKQDLVWKMLELEAEKCVKVLPK